jgi:hypothetical protein
MIRCSVCCGHELQALTALRLPPARVRAQVCAYALLDILSKVPLVKHFRPSERVRSTRR